MKTRCLRPPLQWLRCALYPGRNGQAIHFCPYSYLAVRRLFYTSSRCLMVGLMLSVQHDVREFIFLEVFRVADSIIDPDRSPAYHRSPRGNLEQSSKFCFCPTRTSIGPGWPPSKSTLLIKPRTHHKVTVPVYKNHHAVRPPYCESKTRQICLHLISVLCLTRRVLQTNAILETKSTLFTGFAEQNDICFPH